MLQLFRRKTRPDPLSTDSQLTLQFDPPTTLHPPVQSPRLATLRHQPVRWELVRSRRRTIGFQIDGRGLRVTAPRWVPVGEIERALDEKADWILRKLAEWQDHERRRQDMTPRWEHGAPIRVLGEALTVALDPEASGVRRDGAQLRVGLAIDAPSEAIRALLQTWLREQARDLFSARIPVFSQRLGRAPSRWALSSARTRWGSCGPDGAIRLNWRLVHFPAEVVDYVIAHEMAHLVELNHGPHFWSVVGRIFPDYERVRGLLRHHYDDLPEG